MNARFLLDTNVISSVIAIRPNRAAASKLVQNTGACAIAAPVWQELSFGYLRLPPSNRKVVLKDFLDNVVRETIPILPYDESAASWHGKERARLVAEGRTPSFVDGQIAAVAVVNDLVLVTLNEKDFSGFSGLEIQNWSVPSKD